MAEESLKGVYSTDRTLFVGSGMARRKTVQKRYWMVWEDEDGEIVVRPLNQNLAPSGQKRPIPRQEFLERYTHEPDFFADSPPQQERIWEAHVSGGEDAAPDDSGTSFQDARPDAVLDIPEHPLPPEEEARPESVPEPDIFLTPEMVAKDEAPADRVVLDGEPVPGAEEDHVADEVERSARADFGLGITYLKRGNPAMARKILEEVASMQGGIEYKHKHMFNEFGIGLRKNQMLDVALLHYKRALELSPGDDNLYHNVARIYYEAGDAESALKMLDHSLALNPEHRESKMFRDFLIKKRTSRPTLKFEI